MPNADVPNERQRRLALGMSWLAYGTYYLGRKGFSALKKPIEQELGIFPGALGAVDTIFLVAYAVGQFASGFAGDRFGARRLVGLGMLVSAVACLGFGLSGGALAFGAWFLLNGLAQSTGWPGTTRIVAEWTSSEKRGTVMGLWSTCYQLGGMAATLLAGHLAARFGWRSGMLVPAAAILAVGLAVLAFLPRPPAPVLAPSADHDRSTAPAAPTRPFRAQLAVVRSRTLWSFGASYFFIKLVRYALLFWLPYYLATTRHYSTAKSANVSIAFDAGGIVGAVVIGWLADRRTLSHAALSMLSIALLVPVLVGYRTLGVSGGLGEVLMLALIGALLVGPESLLTGAAAQQAAEPAAAASAAGFVNGLGSFGAALQGVVVPRIADQSHWERLFPALGVFALAAMVALLPTLRRSSAIRSGE